MMQPQIDYAAVRQDLKVKAVLLVTYLAIVRAAPLVIDAIAGNK